MPRQQERDSSGLDRARTWVLPSFRRPIRKGEKPAQLTPPPSSASNTSVLYLSPGRLSKAFCERFLHLPGLAGTGQGQFVLSAHPAVDGSAPDRCGTGRSSTRSWLLRPRHSPSESLVCLRFGMSMSPRSRRALFALAVFFTVCAVAGTFLERRVGAQSSQDESQLRDSLKTFTDVYALVEQNYAEPITGDKADDAIYDGAIPGMLQVLDPHSHFYDPKSYARLREDQRGHYYGVVK